MRNLEEVIILIEEMENQEFEEVYKMWKIFETGRSTVCADLAEI